MTEAFSEARVAILGGSSGIGLEIARLAKAQGCSLVIAGRSEERLNVALAELGEGDVLVRVVDAHDAQSLEVFFEGLAPCDHFVSMIGDPMSGGFADCSMATLTHVMNSKFLTNVRIGQLARTRLRPGGSLTFTSASGGRPHLASGAYVGSLAIDALVEGLAVELAPDLRVNAVAPTFTETGLWRNLASEQLDSIRERFRDRIPLGRLATAAQVASTYLFLMQNGFITGQTVAVDGGIRLTA